MLFVQPSYTDQLFFTICYWTLFDSFCLTLLGKYFRFPCTVTVMLHQVALQYPICLNTNDIPYLAKVPQVGYTHHWMFHTDWLCYFSFHKLKNLLCSMYYTHIGKNVWNQNGGDVYWPYMELLRLDPQSLSNFHRC